MPLIHVDYPIGTFTDFARDALAEQITNDALACEGLPNTDFVRSTTWIYFNAYEEDQVYHGGKPGGTRVITLTIKVFEGGLDAGAKKSLIEAVTAAVRAHAGLKPEEFAPVYVVIQDVPAPNWGVFGRVITLDDLKHPPSGARPV